MERLIEITVGLLALYGLVMLVFAVAGRLRLKDLQKHPGVRVVLLVKNTEEQIEYIIRNAVKNDFASIVLSDDRILVVDMNSTDNTYRLLEKLRRDYSNIEILGFNERECVFEDFSIFSPPPK
jgi:hypothetical protein